LTTRFIWEVIPIEKLIGDMLKYESARGLGWRMGGKKIIRSNVHVISDL
jgi:hypothetical protein